jgi:hypothetical protein
MDKKESLFRDLFLKLSVIKPHEHILLIKDAFRHLQKIAYI